MRRVYLSHVFAGAMLLGCGSVAGQASAPAPPAPLPPNGSRITGTVLAYRVWPPGSLENVPPRVAPDLTLYSLTVRITASEFVDPNIDNLAPVERTVEIFSSQPLPASSVGKTIQATIKLVGRTDSHRWMVEQLSSIR